ncbi:MAG: zinc-dependent metalloprotease [Myxococcaceae bacterium]|nr:zinc-dependent metalloprotease [Myxococcaceae bacterium]
MRRAALLGVMWVCAGCEGVIVVPGRPAPDAPLAPPPDPVTAPAPRTSPEPTAVVDAGPPVVSATREAVLDEVMFSQAVTAPLFRQGQWVAPARREVPLLHGRGLMLQVTAEAKSPAFVQRALEVSLDVQSDDGGSTHLEGALTAEPAGRAFTGDAGVRFVLEASQVRPDARVRLTLLEPGPSRRTLDVFPADGGFVALEPWPERMPLRLMVVPVANDCAAAPALSPALRQVIETYVWNLYPVNDLEVRYHAPLTITGCGAGDVMDQLSSLRAREALGPQWYYQAQLAQNLGGYAYIFEDDTEVDADRVGWVGFWPGDEPVNVAHELGHNHGSDHTFSSSASPPYQPPAGRAYGGREHFGFALRSGHHPWASGDIGGRVLAPTIASGARVDNGRDQNFYDAMSYTSPYWVSAFTYTEWARRIRASNRWAAFGPRGPAVPLVAMSRDLDGVVRWSAVEGRLGSTMEDAMLVTHDGTTPVRVEVVRGCGDDVARLRFQWDRDWPRRSFTLWHRGVPFVHEPRRGEAAPDAGAR